MYPDTTSRPESVTFNGTVYRLMGARTYYLSQSKTNEGRKRAKGLHVAIWEHAHGQPFPEGMVCHHKDHNAFNNHPDNLEPISKQEHQAHHPFRMTEEHAEHLERIRPLASAWHRSEEGKAWHREHGPKSWANRVAVPFTCAWCGKTKMTRHAGQAKYCGGYCNFLALRDTGKYDKALNCAHCAKLFVCRPSGPNKYSTFCSVSCRTKAMHAAKRLQ